MTIEFDFDSLPEWQKHDLSNGLTETTEEDQLCYDECYASGIPFTTHWEDLDDSMKSFQWCTEWEKYIQHYADLIDYEGREQWLPWNLYKELNLSWLDGYNYAQNSGDCASFGALNATKTCNLTNAKRTEKPIKEIAQSVAYSFARGNGKPIFGSGCNLNPLAKWTATKGNYWTSDFGKYDTGRYMTKYRAGSEQDKNALKTQSIPIFLPEPTFDYCYAVCAAGFGIVIGSGVYPTAAVTNGDGLSVPSSWKNGGHAVSLLAACKGQSGKRYVYMENSHGNRYAADRYRPSKQPGCWMTEADIKKMGTTRYGIWYVALCEMPSS